MLLGSATIAVLATVVGVRPASAAESIWDGGGATFLWTAPGNWNNDTVPPSGADVRFGTGFASGLSVNAFGDHNVGTLTVDTTAAFTLANFGGIGGTITLNSGNIVRTAASANTQTISSNLALAADASWAVNGTGGLVVSGNVTGSNLGTTGTGTATLSGTVTLNGTFVSSSKAVFDAGASVTANSNSFYSVIVPGSGGSLTVQNGGQLRSRNAAYVDNGSITVAGAGSLWDIKGSSSSSFFPILFVAPASTGGLTVQDGGNLSVENAVVVGDANGANGTITIQNGGVLSSGTGFVSRTVGGRGSATVTGDKSMWTTVGDMQIANTPGTAATLTVSAGGKVSVGGNLVQGSVQSLIVVDGGAITAAGLSDGVTGAVLNLAADPTTGVALTLNGTSGSLTYAGTLTGAGSLSKTGGSTLTLSGSVGHTGSTTVTGGTLILPNGTGAGGPLTVSNPATLQASGLVGRRLTGTGTVTATGPLVIGDPARTDGVAFSGTLNVGANSVLLADADRATLDGTVNLSAGGRLGSFTGITSTATVDASAGPATIGGPFTNNGAIKGPTATGAVLTFTDDVNGAGSYTGNVAFGDGFSPGNSPANVSLQNVALDGTTGLVMELGGRTAGAQYDRLTITGTATLGGTLDVTLINGFTPAAGDTFLLVDGGTLTGSFATVNLPALPAGAQWLVSQTGGDYAISVVPVPEPAAGLVAVTGAAGLLAGRRRRMPRES